MYERKAYLLHLVQSNQLISGRVMLLVWRIHNDRSFSALFLMIFLKMKMKMKMIFKYNSLFWRQLFKENWYKNNEFLKYFSSL